MLPNAGCLSEWHDAGREETVLQAVRADQICRSQLARSSCGTPYSAPARIYARTYEKRHRDDERHQQLRSRSDEDEQQDHAQNYAFMLHNLMVVIQDYLLLSDDDNRCGARSSLELVDSTARLREDNRICIWLQEVGSEPKPNRMKHCTQ